MIEIGLDIVQRLRNGICTGDDRCKSMTRRGGCDCVIAADEIERLRAALQICYRNLGAVIGSVEYYASLRACKEALNQQLTGTSEQPCIGAIGVSPGQKIWKWNGSKWMRCPELDGMVPHSPQ